MQWRLDRRIPAGAVAVTVTVTCFLLLTSLPATLNKQVAPFGPSMQLRIVPPAPPKTRRSDIIAVRQKGDIVKSVKTIPTAEQEFGSEDEQPGDTKVPKAAEVNAVAASPLSLAPLDLTPSKSAIHNALGVGSLARHNISQTTPNDARSEMERAMSLAAKPDCLSADALKHEPPQLLSVGVSGILVIPSWLKAAAIGKCKSN